MSDMITLLAKQLRKHAPHDGFNTTAVPGVSCIKRRAAEKRSKSHWSASFAIVAQGCKEIVLNARVFRASEGYYTVTPIDLPVVSRVMDVSEEKPFLALLIDFDPKTVSEVSASFGAADIHQETRGEADDAIDGALFTGVANQKILEGALRLVKLLDEPGDARALGPLIVREMIYHLLKTPEGTAIRQFVRSGTKMQRVSQAIHQLKADLTEDLDVRALAKGAGMNRSDFFKCFKEATSMSPIQYRKRLRLHEARRMMTDEGETAEGACFKVGYKSASQFSREYSRMFGEAPRRDVVRTKKTAPPLRNEAR